MYNAYIKAIDPNIDEEVTVVIDGIELTGFASYQPYDIVIGKTYPISIEIIVWDELELKESSFSEKGFQRVGKGFAYLIRGILRPGGIIDAGIKVQDELLVDYAYLYNKRVEIKVDRIALSFEQLK